MITRSIGIDFGTSSSVVCFSDYESGVLRSNIREVDFKGRGFVPTLVWEDANGGEPLFGWDAQGRGAEPAHRAGLRSSFKMGLLSDDPRRRSEAEAQTDRFFGYLRGEYERGCRIDESRVGDGEVTVVTCPSKFDEHARGVLRRAAEKAGFKDVEVIDEGDAALRYALDSPTQETLDAFKDAGNTLVVMLLDMAAGASDVALYLCDGVGGERQLLANYTAGDLATFGGDELDCRLCGFYEQLFDVELDAQMGEGKPELGRLVLQDKVRDFKERILSPCLNKGDVANSMPDSLYALGLNPETARLDRDVFEGLLSGYLPQLTKLVEGALVEAGIKAEDVGLVILTGGHSKWYFVQDYLKKAGIAAPVVSDPDPRMVVARGATLNKSSEEANKTVDERCGSAKESKEEYESDRGVAVDKNADEHNRMGLLLKQHGDWRGAIASFRKAANMGNVDAQFNLARLLEKRGRKNEAKRWYQLAADQGHKNAFVSLERIRETSHSEVEEGSLDAYIDSGTRCELKGEYKQAEDLYRFAADKGDARGQNSLARLLERRGDYEKAEDMYRKAANRGYVYAENNLGLLLERHGDLGGAVFWFREAASDNHVDAQFNLARLLEASGRLNEAKRWYMLASDQGDKDAEACLRRIRDNKTVNSGKPAKGKEEQGDTAPNNSKLKQYTKSSGFQKAVMRGAKLLNQIISKM